MYKHTHTYVHMHIHIHTVYRGSGDLGVTDRSITYEGGRVMLTEILLPRIARLASNSSTGNYFPNFSKRISSKMTN